MLVPLILAPWLRGQVGNPILVCQDKGSLALSQDRQNQAARAYYGTRRACASLPQAAALPLLGDTARPSLLTAGFGRFVAARLSLTSKR